MAYTLIFCDSFGHYDTSGIPLKWNTAGGTIETNLAHVRTGPQSLRIQLGDSPSIGVIGSSYCLVGFAWETTVLSGEAIVNLVDSASGDVQLFLVQNANGSISLWSGAPNVLIATSAPGVLTVGAFWYIEITTQINPGLGYPVQAVVTVTSSPGGVATQVINTTGFTTSQGSFDTLTWGGPSGANFAWVADFYEMAFWDGTGSAFDTLQAPKIYGTCVPNADGGQFVGHNTLGKVTPFPGTPAPWWNQVNALPQNPASFIFETDLNPGGPGGTIGWIACAQAFRFDVSPVPVGSSLVGVQCVLFSNGDSGTNVNQSQLGACASNATPFFPVSLGFSGALTASFKFSTFAGSLNPVTGLPFVLADFTDSVNPLEFGPQVGEPA